MTGPANAHRFAEHPVEPADTGDAEALTYVIVDAFFGLEVSQWLVPVPRTRRPIFLDYFRIYVDHALAAGVVLTTPHRDAAALWLPVGADGPIGPPEGYQEQLAAITGEHLAQFEALDEQFDQHHPKGTPHEHLAILAVRPDRQRLGIGAALLNERHAILDRDGTPAYLEASDLAKRDIYLAHDYEDLGEPIQLPDGPSMYPMWREPQGGTEAVGGRM